MGDHYAKVIFQTRSPVDRRTIEDRRLSLKHEYLEHNPERRVNMSDRRIHGDRRGLLSDALNTFWKEAL